MQHGGIPALWLNGDVDREAIAQFDLASSRMDRPLIVQEHRSIGLQAGPFDRGIRLLTPRGQAPRDKQTQQTIKRAHNVQLPCS
jgi:hypothetical protein